MSPVEWGAWPEERRDSRGEGREPAEKLAWTLRSLCEPHAGGQFEELCSLAAWTLRSPSLGPVPAWPPGACSSLCLSFLLSKIAAPARGVAVRVP